MPIQNITGMPTSRLQTVGAGKGQASQSTAQGGSTAARPAANDTVSLTASAERMQSLQDKIATMPVVDSARVESVKGAINSGNFEIDAGQVASSMIDFETQLYGKP